MTVTIGVATYGEHEWVDLAHRRAIPSAEAQGVTVIHRHGQTLAKARNEILALCQSEWLIYLDADDELEPGYVEAMSRGSADLRAPRLRQVRRGRPRRPFMPQVWSHTHACTGECLRFGNWIVIGACVRTELLRSVGGWHDDIDWSEDWLSWARCWKAGGVVEPIPDAIYRAHVSLDSRNHCLSPEETNRWHREIERIVWPEDYDAGLMEVLERFLSKRTEGAPDDCWEWTGVRNRDGYGSFWNGERLKGRNGKRGGPQMVLAHRWAYEHFKGPIPEGDCVLHSCDNPACVNPRHLSLGSQADNVADAISKGRFRGLGPEAHEEIRRRYKGWINGAGGRKARGPTQAELAAEYGVHVTTIQRILSGRPRRLRV